MTMMVVTMMVVMMMTVMPFESPLPPAPDLARQNLDQNDPRTGQAANDDGDYYEIPHGPMYCCIQYPCFQNFLINVFINSNIFKMF